VDEVLLFEGTQSEDPGEVPFNFPGFLEALKPGHRVLLADGAVELVTQAVEGEDRARQSCAAGPDLRPQGGPPAGLVPVATSCRRRRTASTSSSRGDRRRHARHLVRRRAEDLERIRDLAPKTMLVSKIERRTALDNLDGILARPTASWSRAATSASKLDARSSLPLDPEEPDHRDPLKSGAS
jgi:hypothetical protein